MCYRRQCQKITKETQAGEYFLVQGDRKVRGYKTILGFKYPLRLVCHQNDQDRVIMCNIVNNIFLSLFLGLQAHIIVWSSSPQKQEGGQAQAPSFHLVLLYFSTESAIQQGTIHQIFYQNVCTLKECFWVSDRFNQEK